MSVKVSVIVPAYNAERTIERCLHALKNQHYPRDFYEIIMVDDGSCDNTKNVVLGYHDVRYIRQENSGPATARNNGAKEAKGEIILFTDSDCAPETDWIKEMVAPFDNPEIIAVKGAYKTEQRGLVARFAQLEFEERFELLKSKESIDMVDTYSAGYRKDTFLRLKGFDTSFPVANNEDTELSYRMSKLGYKMVFNPDSIKRYARLKFWRGYWRAVVYKKFPDKMLKDTYTPQTLKLQILFLFLFCLAIPFAIFSNIVLCLLIFIVLCFFVLTMPFITLAIRKDRYISIFAPILLGVRAGSLGFGMLWGMFSSGNKRK